MMAVEQVTHLIEQMVKQLEGLAYTKNAALATKLVGGIDVAVNIAQVSSDAWNKRAEVALSLVMTDKPEPKKMDTSNLPKSIANAPINPANITGHGAAQDAGLPQIMTQK